jgi:hypothetical protein
MDYSTQIAVVVGATWAVIGAASVLCFLGAVLVSWWQDREVA